MDTHEASLPSVIIEQGNSVRKDESHFLQAATKTAKKRPGSQEKKPSLWGGHKIFKIIYDTFLSVLSMVLLFLRSRYLE